jgi:hypothetical protein
MSLLSFANLRMRYDPYPIGVARDVFDAETYVRLVSSFPPLDLFKLMPGAGKYSLSGVNNPATYLDFLNRTAPWAELFDYVKNPRFIADMFSVLRAHHVAVPHGDKFSARFEFSAMPMKGGYLAPHTDLASKVVTLVVSMLTAEPPGWTDLDAGTDVLRPRDPYQHLEDYKAPREAFEIVDTLPYCVNQAVVFMKTFNSWHSVGPLSGSNGDMRRTITINIERTL